MDEDIIKKPLEQRRLSASINWGDDGTWRKRYSRLYSLERRSLLGYATTPKTDIHRISFLSKESTPYTDLLHRKTRTPEQSSANLRSSVDLPQQMPLLPFHRPSKQSENLGRNDTTLLEMMSAKRNSEDVQTANTNIELPVDEKVHESTEDQESGIRSLINLRMHTERSVSRSRMSRISTRRDMDIPSILAYNVDEGINFTKERRNLEIPAYKIATTPPAAEPIPRWSIRRSVCPVCSEKWRDKSFIDKIRGSGHIRKASLDLLTVEAPARLRTSITSEYAARNTPIASDQEAGIYRGRLRNNSTSWQLTRARRFRIPKINMPPEATAPPVFIEPMVRKDIDMRVQRFLKT